MKEYFPFENPRGVYILGDGVFKDVGKGDTLRCYAPTVTEMNWTGEKTTVYPGFVAELSVEGRYGLPFAMPNMKGASGTTAHESDIAAKQETPILVALDTAENREWMASIGFGDYSYPEHFYLRYKADATEEEIAEVEDIFTFLGGLTPVESVQIELVAHLKALFLGQLPGGDHANFPHAPMLCEPDRAYSEEKAEGDRRILHLRRDEGRKRGADHGAALPCDGAGGHPQSAVFVPCAISISGYRMACRSLFHAFRTKRFSNLYRARLFRGNAAAGLDLSEGDHGKAFAHRLF